MQSDELAQLVGKLLRAGGLTLALAESCTGGLVGDAITDVPGSSDYFLGGIVAYSNEAKHRLLGVRLETLDRWGAVSPECAAEMARGARRVFQSSLAVSVTGIAGPGGESQGKPVGLTLFHLSAVDAEVGHREIWQGDRRANKVSSAEAALRLVLEHLVAAQGTL